MRRMYLWSCYEERTYSHYGQALHEGGERTRASVELSDGKVL